MKPNACLVQSVNDRRGVILLAGSLMWVSGGVSCDIYGVDHGAAFMKVYHTLAEGAVIIGCGQFMMSAVTYF
jgi:hypothetical protein